MELEQTERTLASDPHRSKVYSERPGIPAIAWIRDARFFIRPWTLSWFTVSTTLGFACVMIGEFPPPQFLGLVLIIALSNIGAIVLNDIADRDIDSASIEEAKRSRPIASGVVSVASAKRLAVFFFASALLAALPLGWQSLLFVVIMLIFSMVYSLKPFSLSGHPYWSIGFWILLCVVMYFMFALNLQSLGVEVLNHHNGLMFLLAIILFMGIAEILAKDL